ncbi:MAG: metallophosphoesterase [Oscillospiraceae bacterium]|nr:metallophosphoesterase [Oscillospiraceae bacterium]
MKKTKLRRAALLGAFLLAVCGGVLWLYRDAVFDARLAIRVYPVRTDKVTAPLRLAVLSDLHSCSYGENQEELLGALQALAPQPDAVLLAGDVVDDELPEESAWRAVSRLTEAYPCFYVTGNHEWWHPQGAERICREMERRGATVLRGDCRLLSVEKAGGVQRIQLCGIDDPESGTSGAQLARAGERVDGGLFSVLLVHRPEEAEGLPYPFDLAVSGHAHGGQWRLPGLVNGLYAPGQGFFPRYAGGLYAFGETSLVVSRGLARESTRVPRIFNPPEIAVVDILPR